MPSDSFPGKNIGELNHSGSQLSSHEQARLKELKEYDIVGEIESDDFEFITQMAADLCGTEISLISIITEEKQIILNSNGVDIDETPRKDSFCTHTVRDPGNMLVIEDARKDERFKENPYVTGDPHVVFYAGVPLTTDKQLAIGSLCVIDDEPHTLTDDQMTSLRMLGRQAMKLLELRKKKRELEESNQKLLKKEQLLEITQSANNIGAWELDLESGKTYWSDEVYNIHEVDRDFDHDKVNGIEFYHPDDRQRVTEAIEKTIDTGEPFDVTARFITAKDNQRWVRATGRLRSSEEGKRSIIGSFQDITSFKSTEQELKNQRIRVENILRGTNVGHWEWNIQTGETVFNERWAEIVGYTLEELQPISIDTWMKFSHPDDLKESERRLNLCFEKKEEFYEAEVRMKHKDGHWVWVYDRGKVFEWTEDGKPLMMYGTHQDITKRKQYEEQLRISEEAFRGNFENAAIGMAMLDENGHWLNVNARVCEMLGYSAGELLTLTFQDLTHPDDLNSDLKLLKELMDGKRDYYHMEKRYLHKDGHIVYAILAASVVRDAEGDILYFIAQIIDITDLKEAEERLSSALAQKRATMDASTQVAVIRTDLNGIIQEFNSGAEKMLGYREEELAGSKTPAFIHIESELDAEKMSIYEETGEEVDGFNVFVYKAKDGLPYTREWTYRRKNGSTFPVLLSVTAIKQHDEITGYLGVATNISELKKAQKEINTILCITENQNERLQNFSHIVSHNLRSHAGGIIGMLEVLRLEHPEIYENQFVQLLNKGVDNLQNTIESLTELVKNDFTEDEELKRVLLTPYIERNKNSVVTLAMKRGVNVINNVPEDIEVFVIPGYLDSIAMNFITNAIKYSDPEKDSYVKISAKEQGDFVQLSFKDNGLGIDMERDGNDLFGMYNTFHEHEDSRGVGLYITKSQIESMGGSVEVESALGVGTTFRVSLPKPEGINLPKNSVKRTAQRSLSSKKNGLHPA